MIRNTWRKRFCDYIAQSLKSTEGKPMRDRRRALRDVWRHLNLGPRKYWPYKVWLNEIRIQLGLAVLPFRRKREDERQMKFDFVEKD